MHRQLTIFAGQPAPTPATQRAAQTGAPEDGWHHDRNWRFGPAHRIEYRYPRPTSPAPPAVVGAAWEWNPLVPGWRLHYPRPPFSLAPRGETVDRHGPKLLPPTGFTLIDQARLRGRCPRCRAHGTGYWGGPGWHGWGDSRVAAAYETEAASGRPCYGLNSVDVPGLGAVNPMSHYSRWGAGFCSACGAVSWNDFRSPESAYYRPPIRAGAR
jgi:hypothetical protein